MFAWKAKRLNLSSKALRNYEPYGGANRRAINLLPSPVASQAHDIEQTTQVKYHQLLIDIEGKQRTCCLKIISASRKSRAALLVFRGRVVGSLYGRKALGFHQLQQEAFAESLVDLASPGNILEAYELPEELILAASSLFHGQVIDLNSCLGNEHKLESAAEQILNLGVPGCIVISTASGETLCTIYIFKSRILGVYSSQDGWQQSSLESSLRYLRSAENTKVMASVLAINGLNELYRLSFSLTGLADRKIDNWRSQSALWVPDQQSLSVKALNRTVRYEDKVAQRISAAHYSGIRRNFKSNCYKHAHQIYV